MMKIQSHDITMRSHSVEYKNILESTLSFESYITDEPTQQNLQRFDYDKSRTLSEMIQSVIGMLQSRIQNQNTSTQENIVGYTHLSSYKKYEEHQSLDFATNGIVKTDTGEIAFDLNFSMSRSFVVENRIDIYTPFDPLVVNLDGDIPQLDEASFSFDLDNDGKSDQISKLKEGNGFLAFDQNGDGIINQGSELFGTKTGDGFGELRAYDEDHNLWIDENDTIFDKLQIWLKNDKTQERELIGLGEAGIGAIYLDATQSDFTYKTQENDILGKMKSSGLFLGEDGSVGSIAQIDFNATTSKTPSLEELLQA
jgi:hypothetical protein